MGAGAGQLVTLHPHSGSRDQAGTGAALGPHDLARVSPTSSSKASSCDAPTTSLYCTISSGPRINLCETQRLFHFHPALASQPGMAWNSLVVEGALELLTFCWGYWIASLPCASGIVLVANLTEPSRVLAFHPIQCTHL